MSELYQEILDKKYYYEAKGGHYFLKGLNLHTQLENKEVALEAVAMLQDVHGLDELTFDQRSQLHLKIKAVDKKVGWDKLKAEHGEITLIKILSQIHR